MGSQQSVYAKLDHASHEIRLIHIQPGAWDYPILCEIQVVSLDLSPSPEYQTLSYTWGDPQTTKPILLEDCVVNVRANLWNALRRLRCASKTRVIWIDALCINQDDFLERNQQVTMMGRIYSSCREVIMWLGDGPERRQVDDAITVMRLLARDTHFTELPYVYRMAGEDVEEIAKVARIRNGWKVLETILKLPYWERIWIVQENVLPPSATAVLGSSSMPWIHFSVASRALMKHSTTCCQSESLTMLAEGSVIIALFNRVVSSFETVRTYKNYNLPPLNLGDLLPRFSGRKATDPRDKVYAILSLVDSWSAEIWKDYDRRIAPDYSPANSPRRMFRNVTIYLFEATKSLKILIGHCRRRHEPNYPSWIVDWGLDFDSFKWDVERLRMQMYAYYSAAKKIPFVAKELPNERLKIQGTRIDEVSEVGPYLLYSRLGISFPTLDAVLDLGRKKRRATDTYKSGGTWAEAHWRTICANLISENFGFRKAAPEDRSICERYQAMPVIGDMRFLPSGGDRELLSKFHLDVTTALAHRYVFITKEGYLGLGPENMQVGDQVFVVGGSNVPFILRQFDGDRIASLQSGYRLIGDCYVHGIMDGEVCESSLYGRVKSLIIH